LINISISWLRHGYFCSPLSGLGIVSGILFPGLFIFNPFGINKYFCYVSLVVTEVNLILTLLGLRIGSGIRFRIFTRGYSYLIPLGLINTSVTFSWL